MKTRIILLTIVMLSALALPAQPAEGPAPKDFIEVFFKNLKEHSFKRSLEVFFKDTPYVQPSDYRELVGKYAEIELQIGKFNGYELLVRKDVGTRYVIAYYVALYDRQPIVFKFQFYRPAAAWRAQQIEFGTDLDEWLEKSIEAEIGK